MAKLNHDPVTQMLFDQINAGIKKIEDANKVLLAEEEQGAGVREIDKALKELFGTAEFTENGELSNEPENQNIVLAVKAAEDARKAFKVAQENARNLYRVEVLKEEAKEVSDSEVDKEAIKQDRKVVMQSISLLQDYAKANGKKDVMAWADSVSVPQVGRQGTSVVGQKKPRAYVSVNGTRHDSFGEAAKAASVLLSTEDTKVSVTSGDLVSVWSENGEKEEFDYKGLTVKVELKNKDK